jgi:hypothetical protein
MSLNDGGVAAPQAAVDALLDRLVVISRQIEVHRAAIARLDVERSEKLWALRASGWKPPEGGEA